MFVLDYLRVWKGRAGGGEGTVEGTTYGERRRARLFLFRFGYTIVWFCLFLFSLFLLSLCLFLSFSLYLFISFSLYLFLSLSLSLFISLSLSLFLSFSLSLSLFFLFLSLPKTRNGVIIAAVIL